MTRWRSFNVQQDGLFDPGLPTATGPLTATRAEGTNHIYLTFSNSLGKSSGGLTILSYSGNPLSGSVDVRRTRKQISIGAMAVEDSASVWVAAEDGVYRVSGNDPDALESIDTLPRGKYYRAIAVTTKPDRLAATSPAELCFLARELRDRYTRSGTIASLAELAYHTEVLVGFDGDLYSYKPVDKALFTRLSRCDSIDYDILTEVRDSLRDSLSNLTNSGLLGTAIRAIAVEDDPRYVWVGSSAGLFKLDRGSAELAESEENEDNGALRAFPNPARLSSLRTSRSYRVRFTNVNRGSRLIVYTVSGQRVRELPIRHMPETQNYFFAWDGRNDHGSMVEPGTYIYYAFLEGKKGAVGKVLLKP
jgi:ligand-binding sensor domain-containing protein